MKTQEDSMFDFQKEVILAHAMGEFYAALEVRLAGKTSYGISDWYADVAWGIMLFVEHDVPLFVGKNENTWVTLAGELEQRAHHHSGNPALLVTWPEEIDKENTWADAQSALDKFLMLARNTVVTIRTEDADWSGPLPSGEKGVNIGEGLKLVALFTERFWRAHLRWAYPPSPYKMWVKTCSNELRAASRALGEATHGGDLGQQGTATPLVIPWSFGG